MTFECIKCLNVDEFDEKLKQEITIDEKGICSQCREWEAHQKQFDQMKIDAKRKIENIFTKVKQEKNEYDAIIWLSGGKDSIAAMLLAKEKFKLNVLAYTSDRGYMHPIARENIKDVTDKLGIDHVYFKVPRSLTDKVFNFGLKVLNKNGFGCEICGGMLHCPIAYNIQDKFGIPIAINGSDIWEVQLSYMHNVLVSPPVEKNHFLYHAPHMEKFRPTYELRTGLMKNILRKLAPKITRKELMKEFKDLLNEIKKRYRPHVENKLTSSYNISLTALMFNKKSEIISFIEKNGWKRPTLPTGEVITTDCAFGSLVNSICSHHVKRRLWSYRIRSGYITKEKAKKEINNNSVNEEWIIKTLNYMNLNKLENCLKDGWNNSDFSSYYDLELISRVNKIMNKKEI